MSLQRRFSLALACACALVAIMATPSMAIVGGGNASAGEYPAVARITYGPFLCTGTLIAPDTVLSAGHCSSITGAAVSTPAAWPPQLVDVEIGGLHEGEGDNPAVSKITVHPNYLLGSGYDISVLKLSRASTQAPVKVAGSGERATWAAGTTETIVGWGATEEGGDIPSTLQEGNVPVTTDPYCAGAYSDFDPSTMICAGFPQGGVDTCQGDSGGPMFGHAADGSLRVVGATSFGEGCARPNKPGVYARVGDDTLREWIRGQAPAGVG
jgi:secreted trypsin-like serine protease